MKRISLSRLAIRNFKGVREFVMDINDRSVRIFGDNAVGKTTLFDAFTWLLFEKDSQNKKDFQIKTLDKDGNVLHGVEHEVEAVLVVDGKSITLRKVYKEKWTKKRGSATAEFSGHEVDHYINGVPSKKGEFTSRVDDIVKEDIFKLLTSPSYFNEQLPSKKRREILFQVCGDVSDQDVILSNKNLAQLPHILKDLSIDDHRKVIAKKRAEINKELDKIPVRIDEVQRSIPDIDGLDEKKINPALEILKGRVNDKEAELSRIQSGGEVAVKEKKLREIEGELLQIKNKIQADSLDKVSAKRQEVQIIKNQSSDIERKLKDKSWSLDRNMKLIGDFKDQASKLRQQWHDVNNESFLPHHDTNCPTCGQSLPEEQVQTAHDKALANFNLSKSKRLEDISKKGKAAAGEVKRLDQESTVIANEMESLSLQIQAKESELHAIESELTTLQASIKDVESDPVYIQKHQEALPIQQEISQLKNSVQDNTSSVRSEITTLKSQIESLEQSKAKLGQARDAEQRIENLKQQEKELAAEFEKLEQELFLTEEFIRSKVTLLESKINSKFKYARFKLFEQQINGGLSEVCETLYEGVPYSGGLNNAARINVGLDIINTLSEHHGCSAPIFVDNAEAVTRLIETSGQQICLIVSESDKQLRIETVHETMEAV